MVVPALDLGFGYRKNDREVAPSDVVPQPPPGRSDGGTTVADAPR